MNGYKSKRTLYHAERYGKGQEQASVLGGMKTYLCEEGGIREKSDQI